MMAPGNIARPERPERQRARLIALVERLDERAVGALAIIVEIAAGIDPRRGMRAMEAVATLIAMAPLRRPRRVR